MLSKVKTIALEGLNGYLVNIECDVSLGLPNFDIVGLPDIRVKEAKERVKIAIKNSGIEFPNRKIILNLSPANKRKEGTFFDLSIAVSVVIAMDFFEPKIDLESTVFLGELSLDGNINKINGVLPMCIEAKKLNIKNIVLPVQNYNEALIVDGINIIPAHDLKDVVNLLLGNTISSTEIFETRSPSKPNCLYNMDFAEVKGQETAKRALEIAAAGNHNCLLIRGSSVLEKLCYQKELQLFYLI